MSGRLSRSLWSICVALAASATLAVAAQATTPTVTYYPVPYGGQHPGLADAAVDPDGNIWFTEQYDDQIGRITPDGVLTEFAAPTLPQAITIGADGNVWFSTNALRGTGGNSSIARMTRDGVVTGIFPHSRDMARDMVVGSDGNVWFGASDMIGVITPQGAITLFPLPGGFTDALTLGADGNVWFTLGDRLGYVTPAGQITTFPLPPGVAPNDITTGPDGNVWFVDYGGQVGRMTLAGDVTLYPLNAYKAFTIDTGPDGKLYVNAVYYGSPGPELVAVTTDGTYTRFSPAVYPGGFGFEGTVFGLDGRLWGADSFNIIRTDLHLDSVPPVVTGVPDRAPNAAGWYAGPVTIDWQAVDPEPSAGTPTDPPDTVAMLEGTHTYTSDPSVDPAGNSATGTVTLSIDTTAPTVAYAGNAGTYAVDQTVAIGCTASDATSGIANSTCADISGTAASFGAGTHGYAATATDLAGNTGSGRTSFTVVVTAAGMDGLIEQMIPAQKVARSLTAVVDAAASAPNAQAKARQVAALDRLIDAQAGKALTADQAALLKQLAAGL